jgi:ornithine cyclodeaminase/alanine dehydrogenase-like protein (mu-crystallin family)
MPILEPAIAVRSIAQVFVYSRNKENRESFARKASEKLKLPVAAVGSAQQAIDRAQIVLVSTNSPEAALLGQWLRPGLSIFGVGRPNEFDDAVYLRSNMICVTSKNHELGYYDTTLDQPLIRLTQQGRVSWDGVAEFGDLLTGKFTMPDLPGSIAVFRDSQGGYGDLALAAWTYEEAKNRGLGREISTE